nr:hypothetical protein [Tanacetum cinerariifolium]
MKCPQHYLSEMYEVILFYSGLDVSTRQILDSEGAIPSKTVADAKVATKRWQNILKNGTMEYLGQEVNEKVYAAQVGCEQCKGPTTLKNAHSKKKVKPLKKIIILNLVCPANKEGNIKHQLRDSTKEIMQILCIKNEDNQYKTVKHLNGIAENVLAGIGKFVFPVDFIILDMPKDLKVPLILGRPFLSTAHAKTDVFKRMITLRVGDEKNIFKSVKPASSLIRGSTC